MFEIIKYLFKYKKSLYVVLLIALVLLILRLAWYFMPFLIALVIANIIEPFVKFISKKTHLVRKHAAIIALMIVFSILIGIISWIIVMLMSEITNVLTDFSEFRKSYF